MPYSIRTRDGLIVDDIPDDVAPDSEQVKALVQQLRAGQMPQQAQQSPAPAPQEERGFVDELGRQLGLTARAAGEGLAGTVGIVSDPIANIMNKFLPEGHQAPMAKETIGSVLTSAGVPQAETDIEKLSQAGAQSIVGAATFGGLGKQLAGVAQPVISGVGRSLASQQAAQLGGSAASGVAAEKIRQEGGGVGWQILGGLGAGITGGSLANLVQRAATAAGTVPQAAREAEKIGIKVMSSDVSSPETFAAKWLQSAGEKIPLAGTGSLRAEQQTQRVDAVKNLLREYGAHEAANFSDDIMRDLATKRSADLARYSATKGEVIGRLSQFGDVPVDKTIQSIDDQIASLSALRTKEVAPVIERLQDWKAAVQGQNLSNLEMLRKQIGESFKSPELSNVRSAGEKALSSIYGALREDMGSFIKNTGERRDLTKWLVANKRLSEMAGELDMSAFRNALKRGEATPEVINNMLFSRKPSEVAQLYKSLTPDGRAVAQTALLSRAAEKVVGQGQSIENISPDRFANELKKMGGQIGVFFTGKDLDRVKGLQQSLQLTKRAAEAGVAPPTGVQNWYAAMGVGGAGLASALGGGPLGFAGAITGAGGIGAAARLYESAPVRNLLMRMGKEQDASMLKSLSLRLNEVIRDQINSDPKLSALREAVTNNEESK